MQCMTTIARTSSDHVGSAKNCSSSVICTSTKNDLLRSGNVHLPRQMTSFQYQRQKRKRTERQDWFYVGRKLKSFQSVLASRNHSCRAGLCRFEQIGRPNHLAS